MHMANELLSVPVAAGSLAIAGGLLGFICRKARAVIHTEKLALMGIMGAFIFAGQMVNIQLPFMPGTSGHMVGAVLLAIILGPHAGAIVISSVVIIQCLIFQDGGLLALGCNIINMAIVPGYLGYFVYKTVRGGNSSGVRIYIATIFACIIGIEAGAVLVPIQAFFSGVLVVPFWTFLITMTGVHLLVGVVEGFITVAVLGYLQQTRSSVLTDSLPGKVRLSRKVVLTTLLVFTVIIAAGLSLLASDKPDGLELSYAERPDNSGFEPFVSNENRTIAAVDDFHNKFSLLPDYSVRNSVLGKITEEQIDSWAGWTSFAGVIGSVLTMVFVWLSAKLIRRRKSTEAVNN